MQNELEMITQEKIKAAEIGRNIKNIRQRTSLSQESFAELIGVSRQTVVNWERGTSLPSADKVCKIVKECDSTIDEIFGVFGSDKEEIEEDSIPCIGAKSQEMPKKKLNISSGKVILISVFSAICLIVAAIFSWAIYIFVDINNSDTFAISMVFSAGDRDRLILTILACVAVFALAVACIFKIINFRRSKQ